LVWSEALSEKRCNEDEKNVMCEFLYAGRPFLSSKRGREGRASRAVPLPRFSTGWPIMKLFQE